MIDHYSDRDARVYASLATVIEMPDFVKTAELVDDSDLEGLPNSAFADKRNRKFPVHTKKDAFMSRLWFTKNKSLYKNAAEADEVERGLNLAADVWGLDKEYKVIAQPIEKQANNDLVVDMPGINGQTIASLNLGSSPRDFEKKAIQLFEKKAMFTRRQRKVAADALLNKSAMDHNRLPLEVVEYLEKAAGEAVMDPVETIQAIKDRISIVGDGSQASEDLAKLANELHMSGFNHNMLDKAADELDRIDHYSGLSRHYDTIPTPEEAIYSLTLGMRKRANEALLSLQNGKILPKHKLNSDTIDKFCSEVMGETIPGSLEDKLAAVAALPAPDADLLVEWMGKSAEEDDSPEEHSKRMTKSVKSGALGAGLAGLLTTAVRAQGGSSVAIPALAAAALAGPVVGSATWLSNRKDKCPEGVC